jgi:basic membrane lipoprotein Med (substrate-binding protein (PBP1-ABC) superfamily)
MGIKLASAGRLAIAALALMVLAGCATSSATKQAFGASKRFAIVSIYASPMIGNSSGNQMGGSVLGLVKAASKDSGYRNGADKVFAETTPMIVAEFSKSRRYRLMPPNSVVQSNAYRAVAGDDPNIMFTSLLTAKGYKFFRDEEKVKRLAKALNVDGVIIISTHYGYTFSGVGVAGLVAGGVHHANATLVVSAFDRNGNVIWRDTQKGKAEKGIPSFGESVNFVKLHPLLVEATADSTKKMLERLEEMLKGS